MDGISGDLQAKYQKVATEYSKVVAYIHYSCINHEPCDDVNYVMAASSSSCCIEESCAR